MSLSDKIKVFDFDGENYDFCYTKDFKDFIKALKEDLGIDTNRWLTENIIDLINKHAGDELI